MVIGNFSIGTIIIIIVINDLSLKIFWALFKIKSLITKPKLKFKILSLSHYLIEIDIKFSRLIDKLDFILYFIIYL